MAKGFRFTVFLNVKKLRSKKISQDESKFERENKNGKYFDGYLLFKFPKLFFLMSNFKFLIISNIKFH